MGSSSKRGFLKPGIQHLALGLSGRAEYVMPYFTISVGMGANVLEPWRYEEKLHRFLH